MRKTLRFVAELRQQIGFTRFNKVRQADLNKLYTFNVIKYLITSSYGKVMLQKYHQFRLLYFISKEYKYVCVCVVMKIS